MLNQLRSLHGYQGFSKLAAARFISNVGNGMSPIALAYGVLSIDGANGSDLSLVIGARYIPLIALMLMGGVFADRYPRNRIVGGSDMIGSIVVGISAVSLITGHSRVWVLVLMALLFGVLASLWWPAMSGVLPEILPQEKLQDGNAVIGLMSNLGNISGALIGGLIVSAFNPGWGLLIDAATFFLAGLTVWFIPIPTKIRSESAGIVHDLRDGWREFISHSWVVTMVITFAIINMAFESMLQVLGPLNYSDPESGPRYWSLNLAGLTTGMMIGGFIVLKKRFKRPLFIAMILIAFSVIWDFALALDAPLSISVVAAIFSGITVEFFMVTWATSLQSHIPEKSLSRVNAYDVLGSYAIAPLGIIMVGPLAARFDVNTILFATGTVTLIAALISLSVRSVRTLTND